MKLAAVIADSAKISEEVIKSHLDFLPGFELCIFSDNVDNYRPKSRFFLINPMRSVWDYNNLLTSVWFWEKLQDYDRVLIFQQDSGLLRPGIEDFLEWDYVGAPWREGAPWARKDRKGGNGGLSLRNPRKCLSLLRRIKYNARIGYEDCYFSHHLDKIGGKIAPFEVCQKFSVETVYYSQPLGYHAIDKHLTPDQVNSIRNA